MDKKPKNRTIKFSMYWMYAVIILFLAALYYFDDNSITKEVSYSNFEKYVTEGGVERIVVFTNKNQAEAYLTDSAGIKNFPSEPVHPRHRSGSQNPHRHTKRRQVAGQNRRVEK